MTDNFRIAEKFEMEHKHVLRAIRKCLDKLALSPNLDSIRS